MGVSKRICEKIVQASAQSEDNKTQFIVTRFGNVLGSNGSVIPIFQSRLKMGVRLLLLILKSTDIL
jgi:FlaA1/EpsC-like NDP-sugar epimerase